MNSIEHIRHELRRLQAIGYAARVRHELSLTPDDPDLRWALRELQGELDEKAAPAHRTPRMRRARAHVRRSLRPHAPPTR